MKREVTRERKLPSYQITVGELEVLIKRIEGLFNGDKPYCSITLELKGERLVFESIEELKQKVEELPSRITSLSIYVSKKDRSLWIFPGGMLGSPPSVHAKADQESWCAGAIDVVYQFIQSHRRWYYWFRGWPIGALLLLAMNANGIMYLLQFLFGFKPIPGTAQFPVSWIVTLVVFGLLYFIRGRLFPANVLQIHLKESIIKQHASELTLLVAIISLILTILGWYIRK